MIPDKMMQVLKYEGVVALVTMGGDDPHLVNTWNSYIQVTQNEQLLIPVGGMLRTEANLAANNSILLSFGSREVAGNHGPGTGFLIKGTACIAKAGEHFDLVKKRFPWARAAMEISVIAVTQTL